MAIDSFNGASLNRLFQKEKKMDGCERLAEPASPVQIAVRDVQTSSEELVGLMERLRGKLVPVLRDPDSATEAEAPPKHGGCALVGNLEECIENFRCMKRGLKDILDRLEV